MYLDLIEDPWSLTDHGISLSDFADKNMVQEVDGKKDLRVVCSINAEPWFRTCSNKLPPASFPFRSHGEILRAYYLPTPCKEKQERDLKTLLGVASQTYTILQTNAVHRYTTDISEDDSDEAAVNNWINWSIRLFQEIASGQDEFGDDFSGISRRSWKSVMTHIVKDGGQEALMSLIVQLTANKKLRNALTSISKKPRKVLERVRENMKVSQIQQLDGACIREYARRPGYNVATKAGPKQKLLALNRVENTNTLENRVYLWVLNAIEILAQKYILENSIFSASKRVKDVRKFYMDASCMKKSTTLESVSANGLIHPVQPNYPLQLDHRYQEIFEAYQKLRYEQKVQDDAWEWQRVLWGCSARMIFYSLLQNTLKSAYTNFVYVKQESQQGRWLIQSNAPGPFVHAKKHRYYLIDGWDLYHSEEWLGIKELFPGAYDVGRIGCDAFLYSPSSKKLLLIWFAYGTSSESEFLDSRLNSCKKAIQGFISDLKRQRKLLSKVDGLIFASAFRYSCKEKLLFCSKNQDLCVSMILLPNKSNQIMDLLNVEVRKVIEGFLA